MRTFFFRLLRALAALALMACATTARAGFAVQVYFDGSLVATLTATNPNRMISLDGTYQTFTVTGTADSNSETAGPPSQAEIGLSAIINQNDTTAGHTLAFIASDNSYNFPPGPNYSLNSSASAAFTNSNSSDFINYVGSAVVGAQPLFAPPDVSNSTVTLTNVNAVLFPGSTVDPFQRSYSGNSDTQFFTSTLPFGLRAVLSVSLGAADSVVGPRQVAPTVQTVARAVAVPEPGSLTLVALGGLGAVGMLRYRRSRIA